MADPEYQEALDLIVRYYAIVKQRRELAATGRNLLGQIVELIETNNLNQSELSRQAGLRRDSVYQWTARYRERRKQIRGY